MDNRSDVLDAVARALRLDAAERAHLFDLARAANSGAAVRRRPAVVRVRPGIQQILDGQPERHHTASCPGAALREGLAVRGEEAADSRPAVGAWLRRIGLLTR